MNTLHVRDIRKKFGDNEILRGINMDLGVGIHGLLGRNGAGKSTLMRIMTGLLRADGGEISLGEKRGEAFLRSVGYLPQDPGFYPEMRPMEFLSYLDLLKTGERDEEEILRLIHLVHLEDHMKKQIRSFSGGMKRRLGIAAALLGKPEILILDEPTAGLDLKERIRFRKIISELSEDVIVLFSTHIVTDLTFISKNILFLEGGRIVAEGSPEEITEAYRGQFREAVLTREELMRFAPQDVVMVRPEGDRFCARIFTQEPVGEETLPTLEEVSLYVIGGE